MANERDGGAFPWRMPKVPERGVLLFTVFLVSMVVGFLLVVSGRKALGALALAVAMVSIVLMMLTPSPSAMEARRMPGPVGEGTVPEEEGTEDLGPSSVTRPALAPAPRKVPKPPPEAPPLEDLVVDVEGPGEEPIEGPPSGDEDVWV